MKTNQKKKKKLKTLVSDGVLSFECYAYEHGAEIGMWISVNLDLLLFSTDQC